MLPDTFALLAAILGLTLAVGVAVAFGVARAAALAQRDAARVAEATATRLLRLTAHELRGIGMTLHGHADPLAATAEGPVAAVHAASLAAATAQLLGLADELQDHTMPPAAPRILREEAIELASAACPVLRQETQSMLFQVGQGGGFGLPPGLLGGAVADQIPLFSSG